MPHLYKVTRIKKLHHPCFESSSPGCAFVKEKVGSQEVKWRLLEEDAASWKPQSDKLPPVLSPAGLSLQHQWYPYKKIREFCPDHLTCPRPAGEAERHSPSPSSMPSPTPFSHHSNRRTTCQAGTIVWTLSATWA